MRTGVVSRRCATSPDPNRTHRARAGSPAAGGRRGTGPEGPRFPRRGSQSAERAPPSAGRRRAAPPPSSCLPRTRRAARRTPCRPRGSTGCTAASARAGARGEERTPRSPRRPSPCPMPRPRRLPRAPSRPPARPARAAPAPTRAVSAGRAGRRSRPRGRRARPGGRGSLPRRSAHARSGSASRRRSTAPRLLRAASRRGSPSPRSLPRGRGQRARRESPSGGLRSRHLRRELLAQVPHVRLRVDWAARHALDRLLRRELRAEGVEVLAQPVAQIVELAAAEALVQVAETLNGTFPDLHRDHVAERVRREVAERPTSPVHVLQDAVRGVGDVDAEVFRHARVPCLREGGHLEPLADEVLLELEAQDDVHAVGDLVRVDADQRGLNLVHGPVEGLLVDRPELRAERLLQARVEPPPERPAAADEVLPGAALRLVHRERHAAAERRASEGAIDSPLVHPVAELVHRREERGEIAGTGGGRQADVARTRRRHERMRRLVEPPLVVRVAEGADDLDPQLALRCRIEVAVEKGVVDLARVADLLDQRHELLLQLLEPFPDLGRLHQRLVLVEQDVVGAVGRRETGDVAMAQLELRLEVRAELLEVRMLLRGAPRGEPESGRTPHVADELRRNAHCLLVLAPRRPDEAGLEGVVVGALLEPSQLLEELPDPVVDEALLREPADGREGFGACLRTAGRHHHALVPEQQRRGLGQVADLGQALPQALERRPRHAENFVRTFRLSASGTRSSRPPVNPVGRRISTSAMSAPTTTMRVPDGRSSVRPNTLTPFSASARKESTALTATAPTTAPQRLVAPPMTSIASVMKVRSR